MVESQNHIRHQRLDNDEVAEHNMSLDQVIHDVNTNTNLIETPKHFIAMAASKKTAARGKVISATAKKEDRL